MTLEYLREYRTYFHIGKTWGVYESTAFRIVQKFENILIKSGIFKLPGKKKLIDSECSCQTIVIDVTEFPDLTKRFKKSVLWNESYFIASCRGVTNCCQ